MRRQLGVGVALRPFFEAPQVEVLILERVHQLVRHDLLLLGQRQPCGQVKFFRLRLVKTGHLLAQQLDDIFTELKVLWHQAELEERLLRGVELGGRRAFVEVAHDRLLDLVTGFKGALDRLFDGQLAHTADGFQHIIGGVERRRGVCRLDRRRALPRDSARRGQ